MLAFEIHLNGKHLCTAGIDEPGVVTTILTWVKSARSKGKAGEQVSIRAGGLINSTNEHVTWTRRKLHPGDEVIVRLVETRRADKPRQRHRDTPVEILSRKKRYVRRLAKSFGWKIETR